MKYKEYIRYNSSSIEARGDLRTELFDLTARIPFDDMPNHDAKLSDISRSRVFDYLNKVGSKLTVAVFSFKKRLSRNARKYGKV